MVLFAKINIKTNPWIAKHYRVRSTPRFKFFCEGKTIQEIVGAVDTALLKKGEKNFSYSVKNMPKILLP